MDVQDPKFFIDKDACLTKRETLEDLLTFYDDLQMVKPDKETLLCDFCHKERNIHCFEL